MDLLILVAVVVLVGAGVMWLLSYLGAPEPLRKIIVIATIIILAIYFLRGIGVTLPNVLGR